MLKCIKAKREEIVKCLTEECDYTVFEGDENTLKGFIEEDADYVLNCLYKARHHDYCEIRLDVGCTIVKNDQMVEEGCILFLKDCETVSVSVS